MFRVSLFRYTVFVHRIMAVLLQLGVCFALILLSSTSDASCPCAGEIAAVKTDVASVKTDVAAVKTDVAAVKTDVAGVKSDVSALQSDMTEVKELARRLSMSKAILKCSLLCGSKISLIYFSGTKNGWWGTPPSN